MKFLIATFDHPYYLWQCLVQINNFMKYGYDEDTVYIISSLNPSPILQSMMNCEKIKSKFFIYKDERQGASYPVSLRHHILIKFFTEHPEYNDEVIFLTDPDVVFTKKVDFTDMINDEYWHLSDTRSYVGSNSIKSKSDKLFKEMCDIVGVSPDEVTANDDNAGGAQYLMKGINADFFKKTYDDCEKLYVHMKANELTGVQCWISDMWALLWNGLYFGHKIKINKEIEFCWPVDNIKKWNETNIFHNAGIPGDSATHFSKITYQVSPFNKDIHSNDDNCTYMYMKEIKETEENFRDILF
jgi:hypothetical protein